MGRAEAAVCMMADVSGRMSVGVCCCCCCCFSVVIGEEVDSNKMSSSWEEEEEECRVVFCCGDESGLTRKGWGEVRKAVLD